jgi:hypothetical protein
MLALLAETALLGNINARIRQFAARKADDFIH